MIVRIMGEGQYRVDDEVVARLNELDAALDASLAAGSEGTFRDHLVGMVELVRRSGEPVADDTLVPSDAFIPPPDISLAELTAMLAEDGLVPG